MASKDSGGKWAAEVYDFLRLFRRINNSLYGLALIQIGWILLLLLIARLAPGSDNLPPATIAVPWVGAVAVSDMFVPGALLLTGLWAGWSGLWMYIWLPIRRLLRWLLISLLWAVVVAAVIVNLLLYPITWPLETILARRWIAKLKPDEREKLLKELAEKKISNLSFQIRRGDKESVAGQIGSEATELLFKKDRTEDETKRLITLIGQPELHRRAVAEAGFDKDVVLFLARPVVSPPLTFLTSRAYIGLAPIQSFNYDEDLSAAKAPAQIFSTAITRLRWKLERSKTYRHIQFDFLPEHRVPKNSGEASFLRQTLGLDALLWGSYLADETRRVWLNIDQSRRNRKEATDDDRKFRLADLFSTAIRLNETMLVIDQSDIWDAYIAIVVALIQTLQARSDRGDKPFNWHSLDELYYSGSEIDKVLEHLALDILPKVESAPGEPTVHPTPRRLLAQLAGAWVGKQIDKAGGEYTEAGALANRLLPVIEHCVELDPASPENLYRRGALLCLADRGEESLKTFASARQHEPSQAFEPIVYFTVAAYAEDQGLRSISSSAAAWAKYVAYAARAINLGGESAKKSVREDFNKSLYAQNRNLHVQSGEKPDDPLAYEVLQKLLSEDYPLKHTQRIPVWKRPNSAQ